ncbi:forkhead-associated domain-containing protein 1 isoform X2 [Hemicordylus capensis]|uniref:forkhead-associated domain-containing protein 1 isoform X2 n=1 Tax=Hemicordylus capensis TaxID=884348 RepID=UPI0023033FD2|nr:forkhead-associated domain-containing protein 1 isoform X2 [Hemicordylus capensis]
MKAFLKSPDGIFALRPKITTIGRHEDSDIVLKSPGVEDHHAAIEFSESENSFILRDFNSAHGTFVNDCHIQNAAVKVGPRDIFRFGSSGTTFELTLENTSQVSYPPLNRRVAWPSQLQIVTEKKVPPAAPSQFPFLHSPKSPPVSRSWSYGGTEASPHPPLRKKPINAWGRTVSSPAFSPDAFVRPPAVIPGNGSSTGPLTNTHQGDMLLKEKDEIILKMGNEISRLTGYESESHHKDTVIANLQEELAALTEKMAGLSRRDAEINQKLASLDQDLEAKAEEIKGLKAQILGLEQNTSEVLYHSVSERDLQIAHWKQENESLKKSQSLTTGLVTSLQKDITSKEQKIQQLKMEADKLRRESREKDSQLAHVSAQHISELELQEKRSEEEIQKYRREQEALSKRLAEKAKAEEDLKQECERRSQQLQEMGRRERLIRSDMELAGNQLKLFRNQVTEVLFSPLSEKPETDQEIVEKIKRIQETNKEFHQSEKLLREEICLKNSEMKELSENVELLKQSLDGFQAFLGTSYNSSSLKKEISNLQGLCLPPPASEVQASTAEVLFSLLSWVDAVERLLQDVGLAVSDSDPGMTSYVKKLRDNHWDAMSRLQTLQTQLKLAEESHHLLLEEKLNELEEKLKEEFQDKERALLEEEKEKREILEGVAALVKAQSKEAVEELKKRVQNLESQIKRLTEVIEHKSKSEEALRSKWTETLESLEVAKRRKTMAEEKLTVWEKRLKSTESAHEIQKQRHRAEIAEYKEQNKQHSRTIVDLESRLLEAVQRVKKAQEESLTLQKQIDDMQTDMQTESCKSLPSHFPEVSCSEESHVLMKEELVAAKQEILSGQAVISELKKELSEARARMSDVIGELSENQKVELEQKQSLVHSQAHELSELREKLYKMSQLVDQKDADLKTASEELRSSREKQREVKTEAKGKPVKSEKTLQHKSIQTMSPLPDEDPTSSKGSVLNLADQGAKCKGSRHEETILRQKDALADLRKRVRMLEKLHALGVEEQVSEPLIVLKKGLVDKSERKAENEPVLSLMARADVNTLQSRISSKDPNVTIERTAKLEMADALDLSENMYLSLIQDLASLMNVKDLKGMQTLKHLRPDEREKVGMQRQKDLELLFDKISKLKSRIERKDGILKEYERDVGQFRVNALALQASQSEMAKLSDRIYREAEENTLLKEALERTKFQLTQEKRLNRAIKQHRTSAPKKALPENQKTVERLVQDSKKGADRRVSTKEAHFPDPSAD